MVRSEDGRALEPADNVVVLTGFRPDLSFLSELRLDLDPTLEAPRNIAVEIDPNIHSCGSVRATGAADLAQPEPDLYLVGMKSYGRAPTFLALTGYEQIRSVVAVARRRPRGRRPGSSWCSPTPGSAVAPACSTSPTAPTSGGCCGPVASRRCSRSGRR